MSIPASAFVNVIPNVSSAPGNPLALNGLILSIAAALPFGSPVPFVDAASVSVYFGPTSREYLMSQTYFAGLTNSTLKPTNLYFNRYAKTAQSAFMRGGKNSLTLAQIQAIIPAVSTSSGSISTTTLTIGVMSSGTFVNGMLLTGAGITTGTRIVTQLTEAVPGVFGGAGTYQVDISQTVSGPIVVTGAYDLTITLDGTPHTAASVNLSASTSFDDAAARVATAYANSIVGAYASNFGSYVLTSPTTGALSLIGYGSGALATALGLTAATGAVISQGSAISVPSAVMDAVLLTTTNWVAFALAFEPDSASNVYTLKQAFANWNGANPGRFVYVATDANTATLAANGATINTFAQWAHANSSGTTVQYDDATLDPNGATAAFVLGAIASLDFNARAGRTVLHLKRGSGIPVSVSNLTDYTNLTTNWANAYADVATPNDFRNVYVNGFISGDQGFIDNYVDAVFFDSQLQLALLDGLANTNHIPFTEDGAQTLRHMCKPAIKQMVDFGGIQKGVELTPAQINDVNTAAGKIIDKVLFDVGYYVSFPIPSAQIRVARGPWPGRIWYTNGEGVQSIRLTATNIR